MTAANTNVVGAPRGAGGGVTAAMEEKALRFIDALHQYPEGTSYRLELCLCPRAGWDEWPSELSYVAALDLGFQTISKGGSIRLNTATSELSAEHAS